MDPAIGGEMIGRLLLLLIVFILARTAPASTGNVDEEVRRVTACNEFPKTRP